MVQTRIGSGDGNPFSGGGEISFPVVLPEFKLGNDYGLNDTVRYQDVLYRALAGITDAAEVPPFDTTLWVALAGHLITDLGEVKDEYPSHLRLADHAVAAQAADDGAEIIVLKGFDINDGPQSLLFVNDDDEIEARVNNVEVKFDADDDLVVELAASGSAVATTFTLILQVEESTNLGTWVNVKSGSGSLFLMEGSVEFSLTNDSDVSFDLDDGDTLTLRYVYDVTAGNRNAGVLVYPILADTGVASNQRILVTGTSATEHTLGFDSAGDLSFYESIGGADTVLIDSDTANGPTYVGPTDLSGLDDDLTSDEQAAIRTKIGATAFLTTPTGLWLPVPWIPPSASVGSDRNLANTEAVTTIFPLAGASEWEYTNLFRRLGTGVGITYRVTLYVYNDATSVWDAVDTATRTPLTAVSNSDYEPGPAVSLPSSYDGRIVSGFAMLLVQVSANSQVQTATRSIHGDYNGVFDFAYTRAGVSGITELATVAHTGSNALVRLEQGMYMAQRRKSA